MLGITAINRNEHGVIVNVELTNGQRVTLEELRQLVDKEEIGGAYISIDADGEKRLHLVRDGDFDDDRDVLSLI